MDVELDINTYEDDYIQIIDQMKELLYRKALMSCLKYTNDSAIDTMKDMNSYIGTITNLDKLSDFVNGPQTSTTTTSTKPTQANSSSSSFTSGWF